jgi:hypothetical protein
VSPVNLRRTEGRVGDRHGLLRALALGTAGLAATATLTACGFDYPTDRVSNITAGVDYRDGTVAILNAVVVSKADNSGTFVATFVNTSQTKTVSLESVSGDNTAIGQVDAPSFSIQPDGMVNLAAKKGIPVQGTFTLGQFVNISFQFDDGETADLDVPVVLDDGQWAGLDTSTPSSSPSATPSSTGSSPTQSPSGSTSPSVTPTDAVS